MKKQEIKSVTRQDYLNEMVELEIEKNEVTCQISKLRSRYDQINRKLAFLGNEFQDLSLEQQ